jgi:MFS family permease
MKDLEAVKKKNEKELALWQKRGNLKAIKYYTLIVVIIISLIRILDEFVTSAPSSLQTDIVNDFFVNGMGLDFATGLSRMSILTSLTMPILLLAAFYKALADRFGRKVILIISVLGMAVGSVLCWWSPNFIMHFVGRTILAFFIATDIHLIYIMEIAPDDKRATLASVSGFFGYLSMTLVSLSRGMNTTAGALDWRGVFLLPAVCAVVLSIVVLVIARETTPFINQRISYLQTPIEERTSKSKKDKSKNVGMIAAFKFVFKHKQPRTLIIVQLLFSISLMAFIGFYEAIMTTSGMTTEDVTKALFSYPIICAVVALATGYAADKFGRKPIALLSAIVSFLSMAGFIFVAGKGINPYIVGAVLGLEIGFYWAYNNTYGVIAIENVPTEIRSSAAAVRGFMGIVGSLIGSIGFSVLIGFVNLSLLSLVWGGVVLGLSLIVFLKDVKETRGANLDDVVSD